MYWQIRSNVIKWLYEFDWNGSKHSGRFRWFALSHTVSLRWRCPRRGNNEKYVGKPGHEIWDVGLLIHPCKFNAETIIIQLNRLFYHMTCFLYICCNICQRISIWKDFLHWCARCCRLRSLLALRPVRGPAGSRCMARAFPSSSIWMETNLQRIRLTRVWQTCLLR